MYKERKTASKVCQDKWDDDAKKIHKDKLKTIKPSIDNSAPKAQAHLENRRKRDQIKEDRQATIDKHNMMLLEKMMDIMKKPSPSPSSPLNSTTRATSPSKSLNRDSRKKEYDRINQENQRILKKLTTAKPHYNRKDWEEFETKQEKYLENISEYPLQKKMPKKEGTLPKIGSGTSAYRNDSRGFSSPERSSPSSPSATRKATNKRIQPVAPPANKEKDEFSDDDSLSLSDLDSASDDEFLKGIEKLKASEKSNGKANGEKKEKEKDVGSDLDSLGSDFSDSFENDSEKEEEKEEKVLDSARSNTSNKSNKSNPQVKTPKKHKDDEEEDKYENEFEDDDE